MVFIRKTPKFRLKEKNNSNYPIVQNFTTKKYVDLKVFNFDITRSHGNYAKEKKKN